MSRFTIVIQLVGLVPLLPLLAAEYKATAPKRLIMGVDLSRSIKPDQRQRWRAQAQTFLGCLAPGDRIEIFPVHENTHDSAPVFADNFPSKNGSTLEALQRYARDRKAFHNRVDAAVNLVFGAEAKANITDIFSLLDRVHPDARSTLLVLFTDGYHSTAELNLEKVRLKTEHFPELIRGEAQKHNWHNQTLIHTLVDIILPSVDCCSKAKPVNDRVVLEQFYRQLVTALGGRLGVFDTHLEVN